MRIKGNKKKIAVQKKVKNERTKNISFGLKKIKVNVLKVIKGGNSNVGFKSGRCGLKNYL